MVRYTLSKAERLSSVKAIEKLFAEGKSLARYPVRLVWLEIQEDPDSSHPPVRVMFSASKKRFKRAVDRNRIKRLMREAYRLAKPEWWALIPEGRYFQIAFIYSGSDIMPLQEIQKSMAGALKRWLNDISTTPESPTDPLRP